MRRDVAVLGAGYVGLPLAMRFADVGRTVVCVDPDGSKIAFVSPVTDGHGTFDQIFIVE